jgi:hypothetical protein
MPRSRRNSMASRVPEVGTPEGGRHGTQPQHPEPRALDHERVLEVVRPAARCAFERGDDATGDLMESEVIRTHESELWFAEAQLQRQRRGRPPGDSARTP